MASWEGLVSLICLHTRPQRLLNVSTSMASLPLSWAPANWILKCSTSGVTFPGHQKKVGIKEGYGMSMHVPTDCVIGFEKKGWVEVAGGMRAWSG